MLRPTLDGEKCNDNHDQDEYDDHDQDAEEVRT